MIEDATVDFDIIIHANLPGNRLLDFRVKVVVTIETNSFVSNC